MVKDSDNTISVDGLTIDLRNRLLAAFLAWLVPGLGHWYQRRYAKAATYFVAIMSTWIFGFAIGGGRVVYASWQPGDQRWQFAMQAGAGVVAMPAMIESRHMAKHTNRSGQTVEGYKPLFGGFMAPPWRPVDEANPDQVAAEYAVHNAGYEMGTWYTVIAGLLNILVIYDAYGGPLSTPISGRRDSKENEEDEDEEEGKAKAEQNDLGKLEGKEEKPVEVDA